MRYFFIVLVLMAVAFGGGFWWEHQRMEPVQRKLAATTTQLAQAEETVRLCRLQNQLLTLVDDTTNRNYGDAATVSTKFFDQLSSDVSVESRADVKAAMQSILAQRDQVTAALAKGDSSAHDTFVQMSATLHGAIEPVLATH